MNIEVELSEKIDRIMIHSEWICNTCEKGFETKERRNSENDDDKGTFSYLR